MIKFAVIGTNWITDRFIEAAHLSKKMQITAVYSRDLAKAESFARKYEPQSIQCFDNLNLMAKADIDCVYIASPNACHARQATLFLNHGKDVICEKPMASNEQEINALIRLAKSKKRILFEALKTVYTPNFEVMKSQLPQLGTLRKVLLNNCQYSSRYPAYLAGQNPNTFNPQFSNGSLMDIGVYPISIAVALFGEPKKVMANGCLLASGVDGHGSVILDYEQFEVVISHSKVSKGILASEIQGEQASLLLTEVSESGDVHLYKKGEFVEDLTDHSQHENNLLYEVQAFVSLVENRQVEHEGLERSRIVSQICTAARAQMGVVFPADSQN